MTSRTVDRSRLSALMEIEERAFVAAHPRSQAMGERARDSMMGGVPMPWMGLWAGPFPLFVEGAQGARFTCVDGHSYVDFCLGDTGAMAGHSPPATAAAVAERAANGMTFMLPIEDSIWVSEEMSRRFGLPYWQYCLTATDANRFMLRLARALTGRPKVLVFNYCYHGTVDETFISIHPDGTTRVRDGVTGSPVDPNLTTKVVEFNDVDALANALADEDVAIVLAEPAMTNEGIILPQPGFHDALRDLTRRHGTVLALDETHTICAGPGGATTAWDLEPDVITIGKPLAGGVPAASYGLSAEIAERVLELKAAGATEADGIGGTLAGNALSIAAMRATLENVLTYEAYDRMLPLGERWADGVQGVIDRRHAPWSVSRLGARAEYWTAPAPPRNGGEARVTDDEEVDAFFHLYCLNRGIMLTPFHNMALMSPATTEGDVDSHTEVFEAAVTELFG